MLFSSFSATIVAVVALASTAVAAPHKPRALTNLAALLPRGTLPTPPSNKELKYVALGLGTQNYTCLTGNQTAAPGTTGALGEPPKSVSVIESC